MDKKLKAYLLWAFGLAWPLQILASILALRGHATAFQLLTMLVMFMPLAAALFSGISLRDMGWKLRMRGNWGWFLAAWLGPAVLSTLGAALYFLLFPDRFDTTGAYYIAALGEEGMAQLEAQALPVGYLILMQILASVTYAPFINSLAALGEEVGWRGVMLPRLKERFGRARGRLIGGVIWGAWHWPLMLIAGYEYGSTYWGAPVLGLLLFCLFTTAAGTLLDLLYEKTGSIWLPSLAHGAINAFAATPILFLDPAYLDRLTVGPTVIGVIGGLPLLALGALLLGKNGKAAEENPEEKA